MQVVWSRKAGETFQKNIDYLKENWTAKEVEKFVSRTFQYIDALSSSPFIARKTFKTKHTYIGVIVPHISIIYRFKPRKGTLEIVTFLDNRQSLKKNKRYL